MWGHAVATTNGITVKLGSTPNADIHTLPEDTFSSATVLSAKKVHFKWSSLVSYLTTMQLIKQV